MVEKETTKKKTTTKTTTAKKGTTKKTTTKKPAAKKTTTPKRTPKKEVEKVVEKPVVEVEKEETKEAKLEKTIIFNPKENKNLKEVVEKLDEENVVVEDKVIKRSKVKRVLIVIIAILMVIVFAAATAYVISQKKTDLKNNQTVDSDVYQKVLANNVKEKKDDVEFVEPNDEDYENIVTINLAQFESKVLDQEEMTVLVASSTCYGCISFEPVIDEVFKANDKKIYRLDIQRMSEEEVTRFRTYYAFHVTPTLFVIKNGVVTADTGRTGTMRKADLEQWVKENVL